MNNRIAGFKISRREFIATASAFTLAPSAFGTTEKHFAYVGTYTSAADGSAHGEGIYVFEVNPTTGELSSMRLAAKTSNPSWITIHPSKKYLYAINEMTNADGSRSSVTAFKIDSATGDLTQLNSVNSEGAGPAHMSADASGKFIFVANYGGGSISVLPVREDGSLGKAVDVHQDTEAIGSRHAMNAPVGSFAVNGHDRPHAHMIAPDPGNRFVLATDLSQDRIYVYGFNSKTGKLTPAAVPFAALPSGDGPRHFAFHPNSRWLYLLEEEASKVVYFKYNAQTGELTSQQTISTLPPRFAGTNFAAEIAVSPDGRFLYSSNRLHDSIAIFKIGADGQLARLSEVSTMGDYPRHFCISSDGRFMYVCAQRSDCITSFAINRQSGMLTFTGNYTAVGSPVVLAFV